jgi:hypothetical protein
VFLLWFRTVRVYEWIQIHLNFPLVFNFIQHLSICLICDSRPMAQMVTNFLCPLHISSFPTTWSSALDLTWGHSPKWDQHARAALPGSATDPCWKFPGIGQCRDNSVLKCQTQELIKMTPHHCTLGIPSRRENFPSASLLCRDYVCLDLLLRAVSIVLMHFNPSLFYTLRLTFSPSVL